METATSSCEGLNGEDTYIHAYVCVFVGRRWEEQEISGFAGFLELGIQLCYDLLWGESLDGFGGGHNTLFESSLGITMKADRRGLDGSGTGCCSPEISGNASNTEHELKFKRTQPTVTLDAGF